MSSEQQQRDTETRIETKIERNKGGGGWQMYRIRKEGGEKWKESDSWTGRDESSAGNREMGKANLWCGGCERGAWVSYRERSRTALMKKAVQLDGEPSVSVSPGGLIITLHS